MNIHQHPAPSRGTQMGIFEATLGSLWDNPIMRWLRQYALALITIPLVAAVSFFALSQSGPPSIPAIALSADPLYATAGGDKPTMTLALSVEFPTVGAQYRGAADYSNTTEYLGYYNAESCYTYNDSPTETPDTGETIGDYKRFELAGAAVSRMCNTSFPNAFSGNFLNWATNSAIDMMRMALTGGDRSIDKPTLSLLQRALLPNGDYEDGCFFNNSYFPAKQLKKSAGTGIPNYFGAVPASMQTTAGTNDIWIANKLNQIYFRAGTGSTGSCTDTSGYTLGIPIPPAAQVLSPAVNTNQTTKASTFLYPTASGSSIPNGSSTNLIEVIVKDTSNTYDRYVVYGSVTCNSTNFPGLSGSCYTTGTSTTQTVTAFTPTTTYPVPASPASLSTDAFFYARVKVCDSDSSGNLLDVRDFDGFGNGLCTKYSDGETPPTTTYKPTGTIQKYNAQLRLAAFGYLMDQSGGSTSGWGTYSGRYGGVLRAAMKDVGPVTYDVNGNPIGTNALAEWDAVTGVFTTNPDGNSTVLSSDGTTYLSGVINYLNQFGRTGGLGRYKQYDPVGELYGEALRYLQGLPPTAIAVGPSSGVTTAMYDGYPFYTTWTDPYGGDRTSANDYSCLKANILVVGDVNTWDSNRLLTRTANLANNLPDFGAWNTVVKTFEAKTSGTYVDGQGVTRTITNPNTANTNSYTGANGQMGPLIGQAYWAHTHDIRGSGWTNATTAGTAGTTLQRPGLRVKTFLFDVNENSSSNNATYRRTQNQYFMASKYGGFENNQASAVNGITTGKSVAATYNTKGNPFYQDNLTTADQYVWQDTDSATSRVGEANTYFLQSDARSILKAFNDIFARASSKARSIAGGAIQSKNLTQVGDTIYQGTFDTSDWSGDLLAIPVAVDSNNVVTISSTNTWTAATQLNAMTTPATSRNIVVGKVGATANPVATAFTWATIETGLQTNLNRLSPTSTADALGSYRLNYLRGDKTKEGSPFRKRNSLLGDIINSGVVYSGAPTTSITSSTYTAFYNAQIAVTGTGAHAARTPAIFVGANDGMLHAFNATNGNELFAYIPSWLGPKLSALTSVGYPNGHQSYVDGTPVVAEAQVGSAGTAADWKTVLVGSTAGGGQGVFALDVTTPSSFSASNVMWEFTHADDQDMGNVLGRTQILKFRTSAYNATTATYKWFAVVASGVNNYVTDSAGLFSSTGNPALFLLALDKAVGDPWTLGTNYYKISVPVDSTLSATNPIGLINFRAALGASREVTQIYMGDLHGKLWKLDFSLSTGTADWNMGKLSVFNKGTSASPLPYPLYIAKGASGNVQPITMAPSIAFGPTPDTSYIFFGTGKFMEIADKSTTTQQSVYMLYDDNTITGADASPVVSAISGRGRLRAGTDTTGGVISVVGFIPGRATTDTDNLTVTTTVRSGWYFDFATSGERQISSATVFASNIVFGSLIPGTTATATCTGASGGGNQYTVDIVSGNGTSISSGVGIMGEPLVAELTSATSYDPTDSTGRRWKYVTSQIFQQGSAGVSVGRTSQITVAAGRLSWRQINNYQDLK